MTKGAAASRGRSLSLSWKRADPCVSYSKALRETRDSMTLACIAVCHSAQVKPTFENLTRARQTIYQWARNRHSSDWKTVETLTQSLAYVTHKTIFIGSALHMWDKHDGKLWPTWQWTVKGNKLNAIQLNHIIKLWSAYLWEWFHRSFTDGL